MLVLMMMMPMSMVKLTFLMVDLCLSVCLFVGEFTTTMCVARDQTLYNFLLKMAFKIPLLVAKVFCFIGGNPQRRDVFLVWVFPEEDFYFFFFFFFFFFFDLIALWVCPSRKEALRIVNVFFFFFIFFFKQRSNGDMSWIHFCSILLSILFPSSGS